MSIALPRDDGNGLAQRPWLSSYPSGIPGTLEYPQKPLWWLLQRAAEQCPDRVAVHYYRHTITYAELYEEARRAAHMFRRLGVQPGDSVGLLLPNTPQYLIAAYGVWMAGGVVVSMNPLSAPQELAQLVRSTNCQVVVALDLLGPLLKDAQDVPRHILLTSICRRLSGWQRWGYRLVRWQRSRRHSWERAADVRAFTKTLHSCPPAETLSDRDANDPAYILPTGGTTGSAKSVVLTHGNLIANAWQLTHWTGQSFGEESLLAVVPFFHSYGLSSCVTTGVASATTMILFHRFKPNTVAELLETYRPTCFPAVPMMLHQLNEEFRKRGTAGKHAETSHPLVQYCVSGGAPLAADIGREFAAHTGATVVEGYGLSEASPVTHVGALDGTAETGTIGLPLPDTDARIVDRHTGKTILPPGHIGELIVRGPQVMHGYYKDEAQTRLAIRDGWLHTGDLARQRDNGSFEIVDRKKDMIITSGENVYPSEVEEVLRQCPGVLDVAVVGVPDARRGELVKAVVKVKQPANFDRREWDHFVDQHLAKFKRPRILELVEDDLPTNFLGKVVRRELRGT